MRFAQAAVRVWGCQMDFADPKRTALEGIEALRNFLISIGMPKNFAELGAKEEDIEKLAHTCCYGDVNTGTVEGFATLDQKDVENIYKLMVFQKKKYRKTGNLEEGVCDLNSSHTLPLFETSIFQQAMHFHKSVRNHLRRVNRAGR